MASALPCPTDQLEPVNSTNTTLTVVREASSSPRSIVIVLSSVINAVTASAVASADWESQSTPLMNGIQLSASTIPAPETSSVLEITPSKTIS